MVFCLVSFVVRFVRSAWPPYFYPTDRPSVRSSFCEWQTSERAESTNHFLSIMHAHAQFNNTNELNDIGIRSELHFNCIWSSSRERTPNRFEMNWIGVNWTEWAERPLRTRVHVYLIVHREIISRGATRTKLTNGFAWASCNCNGGECARTRNELAESPRPMQIAVEPPCKKDDHSLLHGHTNNNNNNNNNNSGNGHSSHSQREMEEKKTENDRNEKKNLSFNHSISFHCKCICSVRFGSDPTVPCPYCDRVAQYPGGHWNGWFHSICFVNFSVRLQRNI